MAITSLTCPPPIRRFHRFARTDYELLETAIAAHEDGRHEESLALTLRHLLPNGEAPNLAEQAFTFVQGSSRVSVELRDGCLLARVRLVKLTEESLTTATLRFLLSRVGGSGRLYQPRVNGDEVFLEYSDRLNRLHPHKLREVLRQMPFDADTFDDWMVAEFRCAPLDREPHEPLDDDERDTAHDIWHHHWTEVDELLTAAQRTRSMFFLNEITAYAVYHLRHLLPLTGYIWCRINDAADTFNDTDVDPTRREAALAKCSKEMRAVPPEMLDASLGHGRYALSPFADGTPSVLKSNLGPGNYMDTIQRLHNGGRYMDAAVALIGTYNYLLARCSWQPDIEQRLLEGLALANGKPWREAAAALLEHQRQLIAALDEDDDSDDDAATASDDDSSEEQA